MVIVEIHANKCKYTYINTFRDTQLHTCTLVYIRLKVCLYKRDTYFYIYWEINTPIHTT